MKIITIEEHYMSEKVNDRFMELNQPKDKDYPDEPFFEATENFFIVTLPNVIRSKNDRISDRINDRISDLGLEIIKSISENPGINAAELVIKLSAFDSAINKDKIYNTIKRQLKNYVERRGANKTGGYYLKNK